MKVKRLNRDKWGFQGFPYYQLRIDDESFHGLACVIRMLSGDYCYWELGKAGKTPVCGEGMMWLQLIPDGCKHVLTAKFLPKSGEVEGVQYEHPIALWYADIIEEIRYDDDGVAMFVDKYLDVIFSPQGDVGIDDRNELDAAYASGELSKEQYKEALAECKRVKKAYCKNIKKTEQWCCELREIVERRITEQTMGER